MRRHACHNVGRTTRWERHDQSGRSARLGPHCRGGQRTDECDDRECDGQTNSPVPLHTLLPKAPMQTTSGLILHRLHLAETSGELARWNARQRRRRSARAVVTARAKRSCRIAARAAGALCWEQMAVVRLMWRELLRVRWGDRRAGNAQTLFFQTSSSAYRILGPGRRRPDALWA